MKVAVIGSGGREHAIITALRRSEKCGEIVALPGNGGIADMAECVPIKATEIDKAVEYCAANNVDYVIVAPDDPLALGMVDALMAKGIPAFGPAAAAARIEASKAFAKSLMKQNGIPTAEYETFCDVQKAMEYINGRGAWPVVIKADGLALGKGVIICQDAAEAEKALREMLEENRFGSSGQQVVVEEFLQGPEVSVLAFCDGKTVVPMVSSMDHKRALNGDKGLNTGGMGAIAPNPYYTAEIAQQCMSTIFEPTMAAMAQQGAPFKGCLYFGLMLTAGGPKVIEYNCRFGDPEAQVVLPLLQSDFLQVCMACTEGRLAAEEVVFAQAASACVVLASGGYPQEYKTGYQIQGLQNANAIKGAEVYHAGTKAAAGGVVTAGGRVLGVCATAQSLEGALQLAYKAVGEISFTDMHYRNDIGKTALESE